MTFIRIGNKSSSSSLKVTAQYNHHILPPIIKIRQLNHVFLNSISADILETIEGFLNESVSVPVIPKSAPSNSSKYTSTSYDNPPILQYVYPILDKLNVNTSKLGDKPFDVIFLRMFISKISYVLIVNNINMNLEKWGGRRKKELNQIPSVGI